MQERKERWQPLMRLSAQMRCLEGGMIWPESTSIGVRHEQLNLLGCLYSDTSCRSGGGGSELELVSRI